MTALVHRTFARIACGAAGWLAALWLSAAQAYAEQPSVQVLLVTPTQSEDSTRWAGIVRGLRADGERALQVSDLPLDPVFAACRSLECGELASKSAQMPVLLFTFPPTINGADPQLDLQTFEPDGRRTALRASLAPGRPLAQAAAELFEASRRQLALGEGALLRVHSVPVGALVSIDGQPVGVTPFERSFPAGSHALRVALDGFEVEAQGIQLERGELRAVETKLARTPRLADRGVDLHASEPSAWDFVLGGVLTLGALPALIASVNGLANDGQCLEAAASGCSARAHFRASGGVLLATGGLALASGIYLVVAQPFRVDAVPVAGGARLRLSAKF